MFSGMVAAMDGVLSGKARRGVAALLLVVGLGVAVVLVIDSGGKEILDLLATGGWSLTLLLPWMAVPVLFAAWSWQRLFPPAARPAAGRLAIASWIGLAVNWLLPVAQIGGEVAKARLVIRRGWPATTTSASVIADQTLQTESSVIYAIVGFALLVALTGSRDLGDFGVVSLVLLAVGTYLFYRIQRIGLYRFFAPALRRLAPSLSASGLAAAGADVDAKLAAIYDRPARVLAALAWRLAYRVALAGEVWIALNLMGQPIGMVEAILIESLAQTARNAAFVVPAGLGVQEVALILVCGALGIGPETALALAAAKRFREIGVGVPGLVAWQVTEARSLRELALVRKQPTK